MIASTSEQVAGDVELLRGSDERLVGVSEEVLDIRREERVVADLHPPVEHSPDCCPHRGDHSSLEEQLVPRFEQPGTDVCRPQLVDPVLEVVDTGVDGIHEVEIAVRDVIDDAMHEDADSRPLVVCGVEDCRVEGRSARCRLSHGDEQLRCRDDVDLLRVHVAVASRADGDEDAEDVTPVPLEERPGAVPLFRPGNESFDDLRVDVRGKCVQELFP